MVNQIKRIETNCQTRPELLWHIIPNNHSDCRWTQSWGNKQFTNSTTEGKLWTWRVYQRNSLKFPKILIRNRNFSKRTALNILWLLVLFGHTVIPCKAPGGPPIIPFINRDGKVFSQPLDVIWEFPKWYSWWTYKLMAWLLHSLVKGSFHNKY